MNHLVFVRGCVAALAAAASLLAAAQTQDAPAASGPSQSTGPAAADAASADYQSALQGYKAFSEEKTGDWKRANETVREAGGWRAYAKEAAGGEQAQGQGAAAQTAPSNSETRPSDAHGGHPKQ